MEWLQKILSNAVYGDDGKLDVEATMKKSMKKRRNISSQKNSTMGK